MKINEFSKRFTGGISVATAIGIAVLGLGLLTKSPVVSQGVRDGLEVCGGVLIPSLFPFMVLCSFLSQTKYARILSMPLSPVTTRIFKLPAECGVIVLLSLIGGYPVGAKMISGLLEQGRIDKATAERMLCFCVNSGPSFLITAVGAGLLFNKTAGIVLFAVQTITTLIIGWIVSIHIKRPISKQTLKVYGNPAESIVSAVTGATTSMLAMCSFAVLFSGLLALFKSSGIVQTISGVFQMNSNVINAVLSGVMEVTSGSIAAADIGGRGGFALISAIVSFSGLSVIFQIASCFSNAKINLRPFILSRCVHAGISSIISIFIYKYIPADIPAWLSSSRPEFHADNSTVLFSVCLLGMCTIFTLSLIKFTDNKK